ncbi:hypothetical protein ACCI51_17735 [Microbulbifer echini]|uniref:Uncharacterized protein n=1 Tax=Microbulbifer echini TaxID=1529067 RepID=A0ABV4NSA7_9GAMM
MKYILLLSVLVVVLIVLFRRQNNKPVSLSANEVIELLESWHGDKIDWEARDYFESCKIENPDLEAVRLKCLAIDVIGSPYLFQPEKHNKLLS